MGQETTMPLGPEANRDLLVLIDFYEAETYEEKMDILRSMEEDMTDLLIDNMAVSLDVVIPEGEIEDRYEALKKCLRTFEKYELQRK